MAFELKSGKSPSFKDIGSNNLDENESPLHFLKGLRKGLKTAIQNNPISMGVRALKGEDAIRMDGSGGGDDDCNCEGEDSEMSSSEADTPQGIAKAKAQSIFGGDNWKKIKKGAAGSSGSGFGGMA